MNDPHAFKIVAWIGPTHSDLKSFPDDVQDAIGYALYEAQLGRKASCAKPLGGFGGASVMEIVDDHEGDTYRAVYTVKFPISSTYYMYFKRSPRRESRRRKLLLTRSRND